MSETILTDAEVTALADALWLTPVRRPRTRGELEDDVKVALSVVVGVIIAARLTEASESIYDDETDGDPHQEFCRDFDIGWDRAQSHFARLLRDLAGGADA